MIDRARIACNHRNMNIQSLIGTPIEQVERALVLATLEACNGNKTAAARLLGISIRTMYYKLERYQGQRAA